jgi:hypothetical protein
VYHFCNKIISQNQFFGCHEASITQIWILCPLWLALPWHCWPVGTIKIGGLWCRWSCLRLTAEILVKWVRFADVTLEICMPFGHVMCNMPATLVGFSPWCHSLMVVFFTSSCWICYCYSPVGGTVKWWRCPEKLCGVARCSDLQNCSAMMDVRIFHCHCRIPHFMISSFVVALCGFNSKVHSKVWDWCWQIFCGQLVSLILWNDGGIPQLSLWTIWTSQVSGSYERSEYGTFLWVPFCGIYGYIKTVDVVMSHEGSTVSLLFCD